ncbi:MAG: hypothetical protein ACAH12_03985 [Methylophilaceae bacterium]
MKVDGGGGDDGADVFWPGYVDAVTNLVLNLLFVVVIMTVAVFIFAMELGKRHETTPTPVTETTQKDTTETTKTSAQQQDPSELEKQIEALKQQVANLKIKEQETQSLKDELAALQQDKSPGKSGQHKVVKATVSSQEPTSTLEKVTGGLVVDFVDDAVTLSEPEAAQLRGPLASIISSGGAKLEVTVPTGFTEARRLGFYRAMAVRNLLIEMKMPSDRIEVLVKEGKPTADSSLVLVNPAGTP